MLSLILGGLVPVVILIIAAFLSAAARKDLEKLSPFECGFDPKKSARQPFSLRFFLLAVVFLVFDIEIVLLIPLISIRNQTPLTIVAVLAFLLVLLAGLLHEWNEGSLNWS